MKIRKWKYEDILKISEIEKECFSDAWSMQMLSDLFMRSDFLGYVLEVEGKVVGYIGATLLFEEAEINLVAVSESYRRNGYARKMLEKLISECEKRFAEKVFLEVRRSNLPAQSLYESLGFTYIAVREKYYSDTGEDALIMLKRLVRR